MTQQPAILDNVSYWRWVYFPKYIQTCGDATQYEIVPGNANPNGGLSTPKCGTEPLERAVNVCAFTPEVDPTTGMPVVFWAVRKCTAGWNSLVVPNSQNRDTADEGMC